MLFQEIFVSFNRQHHKDALARVADSASSEGFEKITDEDFTSIRAALENEIAEFDRTPAHKMTHQSPEP